MLLKLTLTDQAGKPVTNAQVLFVYTMPMPGMTDSKATARHTKDGLYEGKVHVRYGRYVGRDGQCDGTRATTHCRKVSVLGWRRGHVTGKADASAPAGHGKNGLPEQAGVGGENIG